MRIHTPLHSSTLIVVVIVFLIGCNESPGDLVGPDAVGPDVVSTDSSVAFAKAGSVAAMLASSSPAMGYTNCPWGSSDCNPTIASIAAINFDQVNQDLGFVADPLDLYPYILIPPRAHWQSIQRLMPGSGRFLALSRSQQTSIDGIAITIVEMGDHNSHGALYASNRIPNAPHNIPETDRVVSHLAMPYRFEHAGGIQAIGNYLAVAYEDTDRIKDAIVQFYDMRDPEHPVKLYSVTISGAKKLAAAAITKLQDGTFLLVAYAYANSHPIVFYKSSNTSLGSANFQKINAIYKPGGWEGFSSLNLITTDDGKLYLVGMYNTSAFPTEGNNYAEVYPVRYDAGSNAYSLGNQISSSRFLPTTDWTGERRCNFNAASGLYVDWEGQLIMYCAPHNGLEDISGELHFYLKSYYLRPNPPPQPYMVTSVRASIENGHAKLEWDGAPHALYYIVYRNSTTSLTGATQLMYYDRTSFVDESMSVSGMGTGRNADLLYSVVAVGANPLDEIGPYNWHAYIRR